MHKQCSIHPKSRHMLFECVTIRKSLNAPPLPQAGKRNDQEDDEWGDKSGAQDFQAHAEVDPVQNTLCGPGHVKASEIQQGPDLLLQG
jgi:hypothetical protein